ncbi:MAG: hypothetical protein WAV84_08780, partial [Bacteroidota bacterium]
ADHSVPPNLQATTTTEGVLQDRRDITMGSSVHQDRRDITMGSSVHQDRPGTEAVDHSVHQDRPGTEAADHSVPPNLQATTTTEGVLQVRRDITMGSIVPPDHPGAAAADLSVHQDRPGAAADPRVRPSRPATMTTEGILPVPPDTAAVSGVPRVRPDIAVHRIALRVLRATTMYRIVRQETATMHGIPPDTATMHSGHPAHRNTAAIRSARRRMAAEASSGSQRHPHRTHVCSRAREKASRAASLRPYERPRMSCASINFSPKQASPRGVNPTN